MPKCSLDDAMTETLENPKSTGVFLVRIQPAGIAVTDTIWPVDLDT